MKSKKTTASKTQITQIIPRTDGKEVNAYVWEPYTGRFFEASAKTGKGAIAEAARFVVQLKAQIAPDWLAGK